jgi:hypothetical protein
LTDASDFSPLEIGVAALLALALELTSLGLLRAGGGRPVFADISDEKSRPISVAITPVLDDAPALKLGSKKDPHKLPDRWVAPRAVERAAPAAFPSPHAPLTPAAIPTTAVPDAGQRAPSPYAEITRQVDLSTPVPEAGPSPVSTVEGAADGVRNGTETDPLKAHAVSLYRSKLDEWFSAHFPIRGKVPFETLKGLRAKVVVQITGERTVGGYSITSPSGNATFDETLRSSLGSIQSSGAELPPPPPLYPDILQQSISLSFSCTTRSRCE